MKKAILLSLALLSAVATPAPAETRLVPGSYPTIQQAILASNNGDTVIVSAGTYLENINFLGKNIVVTSTDPDDPEIVAATVINGGGQGSVVTFESGETSEAVLTGFTITGGIGTTVTEVGNYIYWGAGIFCYSTSPTIKGNIITDNIGPLEMPGDDPEQWRLCYGGGIGCLLSSATITNNIIKNNSGYAGAIIMWAGDDKICNNLIYDNSGVVGGGVVLLGGRLINNTIVGNDTNANTALFGTGPGGNVYIVFDNEFPQCLVLNNIICNALSGGGISGEGTIDWSLISFNNVWGNAQGNYMEVPEQTGTNGNISEDPLFIDAQAKDFHLQPDSPCIDAGDPDYVPYPWQRDIDGEYAAMGVQVDIGADEYPGYVKPIADAGPDQHVAELQLITLDGSGSFVSDPCAVVTYEWDQLAGPAVDMNNPTSMHPTFMPEFEGEYQFELVIFDDLHMSAPDNVLILVGNQQPVAETGPNKVSPVPGRIYLDGTGSYDPDPMDKLSYTWTQLEGPQVVLENANTATPFFDCNEEGLYVFELVVNDSFVDSEPSVIQVQTVTAIINQNNLNVGYDTINYFHFPDVSGPTVVYCVGPPDNYSWNIRSKNLETGIIDETFIGGGIDTQPKIDGDIVAWAGGPTNPGFIGPECISVFVRNFTTGAQQTLREHSNTESYSHPAVSANKVVWLEHLNINKFNMSDWQNTPYNICGADITELDNPVYFTIATNVGRRDPYPYSTYNEDFDDVIDISEDIVVWEAEGDIYGADISNIDDIRTFTICSDAARQSDPAISGNLVVWTDERNDGGDIYGADISDIDNIQELAIVKVSGTQQQPAIDGCLIVYVNGNTYGQIKICCLTKQSGVMDIELFGFPYGMCPAIDGQTIVWQNSTYGQAEGISLEFAYSAIDGPVENLTTGKSYDYIQHAIVSASAGDRIVVSEGIYHEDINLKSKSLTINSTNPNDPAVVAATIIDGSSRAVTLLSSENTKCVLSGFTITGSSRGIYCSGGKSPSMNNYNTVTNCNITGNTGAGVELYSGGNPIITNCSISANAGAGFEMHLRRSGRFTYSNYPKINNCIIAANHRHGISGGIPKITNCNIVGNLQGGIDDSRPLITNSIIYYNGDGPDTAQIANSVATVTYSDVQGSWPGVGNIDADPCFVTPCYWADAGDPNTGAEPGGLDIIWIDGDYHLKSEAGHWDSGSETWVQDDLGSPCIDAGDPDSCIGFEPNPNGSVINIGAYGGTAQAGLSPSGVSCISADHPDYDEWVAVGEPVCWCYRRQCHGDADCKSQSAQKYWVSTDDLDILIAAWCKPYSAIEGVKVSGLDLVCADFDHKAQGKNKYRVSVNDLDILIANWNIADGPDPNCP